MARARNIKPAFFQNEQLGELLPIDRLAFIGLWTVADYKGCVEFRPKRLKVQILPYDNCDLTIIATNLELSGFIQSYSVQGQLYIKILNFEKHQNPHKNERDSGSEIPDIDKNDNTNKGLLGFEINREQDGTTRADSLLLIPDSLTTDSLVPAEKSKPQKHTNATRLPADWELSSNDRDYCLAKRPDLSPDDIAEQFKNYWIAKSGKDATKLDWSATWRNWVINQRSPNGNSNNVKPMKGLGVISDEQFNDWLNGEQHAGNGQKAILGNG